MAANPPTDPSQTTDDALLGGTVTFRQPAAGYRAAVDPVLLAAAVPDAVQGRVLDLGCGAGAVMLCLARRRADLAIVGLERDPELARLATHNTAANGFNGRVSVVTGDLLRPPPQLAVSSFDAVIANPPYLDPASADVPPNARKKAATVESDADLRDWARAASRFVKPQGLVIFIHRADRLGEVQAALELAGCGGAVTIPVWPRLGVPPIRGIVVARRGDAGPRRSGNGLILHEVDGRYTAQADAILRGAASLPA